MKTKAKAEKLFFDLQDIDLSIKPQGQHKISEIACITQAFGKIAKKQRQRDRAVYTINREKTSFEIRQALLDAPLVTESKTKTIIKANEKELAKALENFRKQYPNTTSADLQTFILGWRAGKKDTKNIEVRGSEFDSVGVL